MSAVKFHADPDFDPAELSAEIAPLLIVIKLEQYDYAGATAIAVVMLTASFVILLAINLLQWWAGRAARTGV